ncbi:hypothetical protein NQ315_004980 [Exocentrus adspersus]|uniref:Uncharacterized protein n=1 Tax=Exocentrus adspersus TaxID=1586481 RepID=A0AAV8V632_9CUCU|nr:hypothetical protein NQ315_004980 [Exocentrus adspersus]
MDGQYEKSYGAYEQALHWLTEEQSSQSDLLVALASMAYMFQGADAAKTLLFQSIQLKPPSPWSLYATLALALLHKDSKLTKLVTDELAMFKDKKECLKHYALLISNAYLLQVNYEKYICQGCPNKAVKEVSNLIHKYPNDPYIWLTLSILLIRSLGEKGSYVASKCALTAMIFGQTNMDVTKVLCLVSQASFLAGNDRHALILAQKAVHCYPNVAEGWVVLISSLLNAKRTDYRMNNLVSAMSTEWSMGPMGIQGISATKRVTT